MPEAALDLGLLLDIDGPIASPVSRTIAIPRIIAGLVALTAAGVPIAFITGRSDAFVRDRVIAPLLAAGLDDALSLPGARMFAVFEKGAAWSSVGPTGLGEVAVDESVRTPETLTASLRSLHAERFADTMFWDETKRAMVSVEQRVDVHPDAFAAARHHFVEAAFAAAVDLGLGIRIGERAVPDAQGGTPWRIDPTVISVDVESVRLDKDRGAERALDYFRSTGPLPGVWRTLGDSRSDYLMADHLHAVGLDVAHVDVRPSDGVLDRPYRIVVEGDLIHDEAGAAFLDHWVAKLAG